MSLIECNFCGKKFETNNSRKKYCCYACNQRKSQLIYRHGNVGLSDEEKVLRVRLVKEWNEEKVLRERIAEELKAKNG